MKKIYSLLLMLFSVLIISSCTDSIDECVSGELATGQGVFFPTSTINSYEAESANGSITVKVGRTIANEAVEVDVKTVISEGGEGLFQVPTKVSFEQDKLDSEITISYNNLKRGTTYTVTVSFPGNETNYSQSSLDFTIVWPNEVVYEWEVVSENAVLIDNLFSGFGVNDLSISELTVEKAKGYDLYRIKSPYDNSYFDYLFGINDLFSADFEYPYILLDGETYKSADASKHWYIPSTSLGFKMINGVGPEFDTSWDTFGSVAGNLKTADGPIEPGNPSYPLGSYDDKTKCFDLGMVYHNIDNDGSYMLTVNAGEFKLYLDPSLMSPDYNRDYTWNEVAESEGEYISELAGQNMVKVLEQAEEDETFYRIPDLYAQGYPLYFNLNKEEGTVSIPKDMPLETGLTVLGGNKVYVKGVSGKSSYNPENGVITFGLSFYLADNEGNEITELATSEDQFVWGKTGAELFKAGVSIDEYLGNWGMLINVFENDGSLTPYETGAIITKTANVENSLSVRGILGDNSYDDSFNLKYSPLTGLLEFSKQDVNSYSGYPTFVTLVTEDGYLADESQKLVGGISIIDGNLKFVNSEGNSTQWPYISYIVDTDYGFQLLAGFIELDWSPITASSTSVLSSKPMIFSPSNIKDNNNKLNVKLYDSKKNNSSNSAFKLKDNFLQKSFGLRLCK